MNPPKDYWQKEDNDIIASAFIVVISIILGTVILILIQVRG